MSTRGDRTVSRRSVLVMLGGLLAPWPVVPRAMAGESGSSAASENERAVIEIGNAPTVGPATAPVTIVEFADFRCPYSAQGARALRRVMRVYPGQVRWVFKHRPLGSLVGAATAPHRAAEAAHLQGKFWEMSELIFLNQARLGREDLIGYAQSLDLEMTAFTLAVDRARTRGQVALDTLEAHRLKVVATPTYFVNGRRVVGAHTLEDWRRLVDEELAAARSPAPAGPAERR